MQLLKCGVCNNTGKIAGLGSIEENCLSPCCNLFRRFKGCLSCVVNWIKQPMNLSIIFFIFAVVLASYYQEGWAFTFLASSFGSVFIALKFKLDKANYNKDLFEKRYEVFSVIGCVLWDYYHPPENIEVDRVRYKEWSESLIAKIDVV